MANYDNVVSKGVHSFKDNEDTCDITVSFDESGLLFKDFQCPIRVTVLDQGRKGSGEDAVRRFELIKSLNTAKLVAANFVLSNETMPLYNAFMSECGWDNKRTGLYMPVDYEPLKIKDLKVELCRGTLMVPETTLLWMKNMDRARGKVNREVLEDAEFLKKFIPEFMQRLYDKYDFDRLDDFDKTQIIYDFVKNNIQYAYQATEVVNGRRILRRDADSAFTRPVGTLLKRQGVCSGKARLGEALLHNPYMGINASTVYGRVDNVPHAWLGVEINDKFYQLDEDKGAFRDLDKIGFNINNGQMLPSVYEHDFLSNPEIVRETVKTYTKK